MCAANHVSATHDARADSRADHQHDYIRPSSRCAAPAFSQQCGIAIALDHHWNFKKAPQTVGERQPVPTRKVRSPNRSIAANQSWNSDSCCDEALLRPGAFCEISGQLNDLANRRRWGTEVYGYGEARDDSSLLIDNSCRAFRPAKINR